MTPLEFFASLAASLAWPVIVLVLVVILREPLRRLPDGLRKFRYGDLELDFGRQVEKLEARAGGAVETSGERDEDAEVAEEDLPPDTISIPRRLVPISPRAAVAEAWRGVEHALVRAAEDEEDVGRRPLATIEALRAQGDVAPPIVELLHGLRRLRNDAVHAKEFDLTPQGAMEFIELAEKLKRVLAPRSIVYELLPDGDDWIVKRQGAARASGRFSEKRDAVQRAKNLARRVPPSRVLIHRQDGSLESEYTYDGEPV